MNLSGYRFPSSAGAWRATAVYLALAFAWLGLGYFGSNIVADKPLWVALAMTLVLALPLLCAGLYGVTVRRIRRAHYFSESGLLHGLATGRLLASIFWLLWSVTSGFLMFFYLRLATNAEWGLLLAAPLLFALLVVLTRRLADRELKPYLAVQAAQGTARWLFAVSMAMLQFLLVGGAGSTEPLLLEEAIAQVNATVPTPASNSVLVQETAHWLSFWAGLKLYTLGHIVSASNLVYLALVVCGNIAFYYNVGLALSAFSIPQREYRRILAPVAEYEQVPRVAVRTLATTIAVSVFTVGFIILPLTAYLELWLSTHPTRIDEMRQVEQRAIVTVEKIEDRYYRQGTAKKIQQARISTLAQLENNYSELRRQADLGYELMAGNVDSYLDWYYSLPAEYGRILALLSGNIETLMAEQLQEHLTRGDAFGQLQQSIAVALERQQDLKTAYLQSVQGILRDNELDPSDEQKLRVTDGAPVEFLSNPPDHAKFTSLQGRLLASGATGAAITGVIAAKVTAKAVGKGTIKLGAKALAKVAASKASGALGGTAAGAAAGAAAGSVVPGLGTVIGGAIGGIVGGIAVGLSVEVLLLMLEEALSREDFKNELLQAIDEARAEFNAEIKASALPTGASSATDDKEERYGLAPANALI